MPSSSQPSDVTNEQNPNQTFSRRIPIAIQKLDVQYQRTKQTETTNSNAIANLKTQTKSEREKNVHKHHTNHSN